MVKNMTKENQKIDPFMKDIIGFSLTFILVGLVPSYVAFKMSNSIYSFLWPLVLFLIMYGSMKRHYKSKAAK